MSWRLMMNLIVLSATTPPALQQLRLRRLMAFLARGTTARSDCLLQDVGCPHRESTRGGLELRPVPKLGILNDTLAFVPEYKPFIGQVVELGKAFQGHVSSLQPGIHPVSLCPSFNDHFAFHPAAFVQRADIAIYTWFGEDVRVSLPGLQEA